jgi:hypothetical protein
MFQTRHVVVTERNLIWLSSYWQPHLVSPHWTESLVHRTQYCDGMKMVPRINIIFRLNVMWPLLQATGMKSVRSHRATHAWIIRMVRISKGEIWRSDRSEQEDYRLMERDVMKFYLKDGRSRLLRNLGTHLPNCTVPRPWLSQFNFSKYNLTF